MIPRIKKIKTLEDYILHVKFDHGASVLYDVKEDIATLPSYKDLEIIPGLFERVQLDESRTCVFWTEEIDLPSDTILEYGTPIQPD